MRSLLQRILGRLPENCHYHKSGILGDLKETIRRVIRAVPHASFVDVQREVGEFFDTKGEVTYEISGNVVIWCFMSQEFAEAVTELVSSGEVFLKTCAPLVYALDGRDTQLPCIDLNWIPVCLYIDEAPEGALTAARAAAVSVVGA